MRDTTYFISDLHLGAAANGDCHEHQRKIAKWLREIAPTAKAIYLLGDILDYWYEYKYVVPRGYVRFFGALAELSDRGVEITWLKGNHDIWIFDYLPKELGITVVDGMIEREIDGRRFVMEHGDGVGEMRRSYRFIHSFFRNRFCQWLYAGIHPRWTVGFAHNWSSHSRRNGKPLSSDTLKSDDPLLKFSLDFMKRNGHVDYFVYGHRHYALDQMIADDTHLILLGDGFDKMTYGKWDGKELKIEKINC